MEKATKTELIVSAIENGTVIDHIPSDKVDQVMRMLDVEHYEDEVLVGMNLKSKKYGIKGIIKIKNRFFEPEDINKIALVAPSATIIIIRDYEVVEKIQVEIPEYIDHLVKCINPNCITNVEEVPTRFTIVEKEPLRLKCHYCEKLTDQIRFL